MVYDNRRQQDDAQEDLKPVRIDSGHDDPLLNHAEDESPQRSSDR
jgi:hypothetical protein